MSQNLGGRLNFSNFDFPETARGRGISADMTSFQRAAILSVNGTLTPSRTDVGRPYLRVSAPPIINRPLAELASGRRYFERLINQPDPERLPGIYLAAACVYIAYNPELQMDDVFLMSPNVNQSTIICEYPQSLPSLVLDETMRN